MSKYITVYTIVYSILSLFNGLILLGIIGILFVIIGLPHGSLDIYQILKITENKISRTLYFLFYILIAILAYILWYNLPQYFWPTFFIISLLHFLKIEYFHKDNKNPELAYCAVLILPLIKFNQFTYYIVPLGGETLIELLNFSRYYLIFGLVLVFLMKLYYYKVKKEEVLTYLTFGLITYNSDIIISFFFYFFLHSFKHIENSKFNLFNKKSLGFLAIISIILIIIFLFTWKSIPIELNFIMGLAMLTFPHFFLDLYLVRRKLSYSSLLL